MITSTITEREFAQFQRFIHDAAGIKLTQTKQILVSGRLAQRLAARGCASYGEYFHLLESGSAAEEVQTAIDLLTTNETYFFREPKHFDVLRECVRRAAPQRSPFRVWSAASSSGEEAYSIAMVLADCLGAAPWEVVGTDLSTRMLARARTGHYALTRTDLIPAELLQRYCLKGTGAEEGSLLVGRPLRERVQFLHVNLNQPLPAIGPFDVVFLRNVLIYFDAPTKQGVVTRVLEQLKPGGCFIIGHSDTLSDIKTPARSISPSVFVKP